MPPLLPVMEGVCDSCGAKNSLVQRADDTKEIITDRLRVYHEETAPLIDYYRQRGPYGDTRERRGVRCWLTAAMERRAVS